VGCIGGNEAPGEPSYQSINQAINNHRQFPQFPNQLIFIIWLFVCLLLPQTKFPKLQSLRKKSFQLASTIHCDYLFVPDGPTVKMLEPLTGRTFRTFKMHFSTVNACAFNPQTKARTHFLSPFLFFFLLLFS
jgi:hypothetical protein